MRAPTLRPVESKQTIRYSVEPPDFPEMKRWDFLRSSQSLMLHIQRPVPVSQRKNSHTLQNRFFLVFPSGTCPVGEGDDYESCTLKEGCP